MYSWVGALRRAKERRPDLVLGVMGCMAQRAEEEIFQRAAHVDVVCGTRRFQHLPALVDEVRARRSAAGRPVDAARLADLEMDAEVRVDRAGGDLEARTREMNGLEALKWRLEADPRLRSTICSLALLDGATAPVRRI